jgi:prevent-host-death family protein
MTRFNMHDAKTHFSKLVERAERGEEIEICRNGERVAKLVPSADAQRPGRRPGAWADEDVWIAPDFDETPEEVLRDFGMLDDDEGKN